MTTQIVVEGVKSPCINRYGRYLTGGNTDTYIHIYHTTLV